MVEMKARRTRVFRMSTHGSAWVLPRSDSSTHLPQIEPCHLHPRERFRPNSPLTRGGKNHVSELINQWQFAFPMRRLTPDRPLVWSPESGHDVMENHSFRPRPSPTCSRGPTRHRTQEWGGNCWDIPTDLRTLTYPRTGPTDARLYQLDRRTTPTTTPTMTADNGCRQYPAEEMPVEQTHIIFDRSNGRTHITDLLSGVAPDD